MTVSITLDRTTNRPDTDAGTDDTARDTARDTGRAAATSRPAVNGTARAVPGRGPADPGRADAASGADDEVWPSSPFACVDTAFTALVTGPDPLSIDLTGMDPDLGLPEGVVSVAVLRTWLAEHPRDWAALDAVWRELIVRARLDGPAWVVATTALALPGLVRHAALLVAGGWYGDPDDVDAEVLTGFLTALRDHVDVSRPAPYAQLCKAGYRAGLALVAQQRHVVLVDDLDAIPPGPRTPHRPWKHPDLLVQRAVALGLLDACDEEPYIDTRLGKRAIEPIAVRLGVTVDALRMRLNRIDERIAAALAEGLLTGATSPEAEQELAKQAAHRQRTRAGVAARTTDRPLLAAA
ncbi:hypothetical protein AB0K00_21425 [Dactylosporangium sp. NPDC049525]|uniref:hypothetical protein n=1 Tax=Dactylosporangium sp. NPDC049525 TaxID=3154730 RepID=UPI0034136234